MSYPDQIIDNHLVSWAMQNECVITIGECGIGRPCVGLNKGGSWVDYPDWPNAFVELPEDAYHKHNCVAVLIHDDDPEPAWRQLRSWLLAIMGDGWRVETITRENQSPVEAILHGMFLHRLVKP